MSLHLSADLDLPLDAATGTFGILATKGAGKSNAAVVMAEQMYDAGIPWVAVDPKGDWWGVRSSADGSGPGLPVVVFGGRHGDVPLEPTGGHLIADLVLSKRLTCVLDVSQFTKADATRFLLAFGTYLFRHADDDGAEPIHLFLEEAHEYLPQVVRGEQAHLVEVWQRIVKQGRFKGMGVTLISQRSSVLNKDVLELIDSLIVLRTIGPRSRQAIRDWVRGQDVPEDLLDSLPSLGPGEAWVWSPGEPRLMQRIRFDRRRTFDSGATPKVGTKRREPTTLADIDLAEIKERMADTIEKVAADDPKALRRRVRELEHQLANQTPPERIVETVEVVREVVPPALVSAIESVTATLSASLAEAVAHTSSVEPAKVTRPVVARPPAPARLAPTQRALASDASVKLGRRERAILTVLIHHPGADHRKIGLLSGYSQKASTIGAGMSTLRKLGYVGANNMPTEEGVSAIEVEDLPTGPQLLAYWNQRLGKRERAILEALIDAYPNGATHDEVCAATGYSPEASTVGAGMSSLRGLGIADGWRVSDEFMEAIR